MKMYFSKKQFENDLKNGFINKDNVIKALKHCLPGTGIKKDKELMCRAMALNPDCYAFLPKNLREDEEILTALMGKNEYVANLAPKDLQQKLKDAISDKGTGIDDSAKNIFDNYDDKQLEVIFYDLAKNGTDYSVVNLFQDITKIVAEKLDKINSDDILKLKEKDFKKLVNLTKNRLKKIKAIALAQVNKVENEIKLENEKQERNIEKVAKQLDKKEAKEEAVSKKKNKEQYKQESKQRAKQETEQKIIDSRKQLIQDLKSSLDNEVIKAPRTIEEIKEAELKAVQAKEKSKKAKEIVQPKAKTSLEVETKFDVKEKAEKENQPDEVDIADVVDILSEIDIDLD